MRRAVLSLILAVAAFSCTAYSQTVQSVVAEMARAIGSNHVQSIRYSATGLDFALGQNHAPGEPWPRFRLERYERHIDYAAGASEEVLVRTQGEDPPRGGGNQPLIGAHQQLIGVSGRYAWNQLTRLPQPPGEATLLPARSDEAVAAPASAHERRLHIWMTPHGFIQAALTREANLSTHIERRRRFDVVSFDLGDGVAVQGLFNENHLLERVRTYIAHPVLGDMAVEIGYYNYKSYGDILFPEHIIVRQAGFRTMELTVSDVEVNPSLAVQVPPQARIAEIPRPTVAVQPLGEGLWLLSGGTHNSVVVEFRDFVTVIEAPQNEEQSLAVIAKVRELVPQKPLQYLVNTHHHFDHSGGVRTYASLGTVILTHESNRRFFGKLLSSGRVLVPDRLARNRQRARLAFVRENYSIRNGSRVVEIHHLPDNQHDAGMLIIHLPRERLLIQADLFSPGEPDAAPPAAPNPFAVSLYEAVVRLKLNVTRIASIRGRVVPWSELLRAIGKPADDTPAEGLMRAETEPPVRL